MTQRTKFDETISKDVEQVLYRTEDITVTSKQISAKRNAGRASFVVNYNLDEVSNIYISNNSAESGSIWFTFLGVTTVAIGFGTATFMGFQNNYDKVWITGILCLFFGAMAFSVLRIILSTDVYYVYVHAKPIGLHLYEHHFIVFSSNKQEDAEEFMNELNFCRRR